MAGIALALAGTAAQGPARAEERLDGPVPAEVLKVIDGDTLSVRAHIWIGQRVETLVRLIGIDAPELHGKCARERTLALEARAFVSKRLGTPDERSGRVLLRDIRFGKYAGRVLARVEDPGGVDLGEGLIAEGLARRYAGGARAAWCGGRGPASARLPSR